MGVIRKKARGRKVTVPETPKKEPAPDLMEALKASLDEAAAGRRARSNGGRGRRRGDLDDLTVEQLRRRAAEAGIEGRPKMGRKELEAGAAGGLTAFVGGGSRRY